MEVASKKLTNDMAQRFIRKKLKTIEELLIEISVMKIVVATRYHGTVLSYTLGKPVLGIAYQPKTVDLIKEIDDAHATIDINNLDISSLKSAFVRLENNFDEISSKIEKRRIKFQKKLSEQYDNVIAILSDIQKTDDV
jgi:polysaccharide pyruvyl transferase WcaK-like protein